MYTSIICVAASSDHGVSREGFGACRGGLGGGDPERHVPTSKG